MAFVDILGLEIVMIFMGGLLLTYLGVAGFFALRRNDRAGLAAVLKGGAGPVGIVGGISAMLGLWGEMAWPLPGSYNILFTDVFLLFGAVLVAFAVAAAGGLKLQYVGLFAAGAGIVTAFYAQAGYALGMTKEPLQMFLLFGSFALAGLLALPATFVVDRFVGVASPVALPAWNFSGFGRGRPMGARAVQGVAGSAPSEGDGTNYRVPAYVSWLVLAFPVFMAIATIAAAFFLNSTIPGHLKSAP
jgi:putative membrane protein